MSDVVVKRVSDIGFYQGPNAIPGIKFRLAGRELGVQAWGMNVLELDPHCPNYPDHDHAADGQEEVYVVLRGSATLQADGETQHIEPGTLVRVGPNVKRKIVAGADGVTVLAIGGTPGKAYTPRS